MDIRVVSTVEDFKSLKNDWDRLASAYMSVNSFDWQFEWWNQIGSANKLNIIVATVDGEIKGIAPLYTDVSPAFKFIPFNRVCFLGGDVSDYLDFLVVQDSQRELIFNALFDYAFTKLKYDVFDVVQLNASYPNHDLWQHVMEKYDMFLYRKNECHRVNLLNFYDYEDYFDNINKNLKRSLKYRQRKLDKSEMKVEYIFSNKITQDELQQVGQININRQKFLYAKGDHKRDSLFADNDKKNFINATFGNKNNDNKMLAYMTCNGVMVSYALIIINRKSLCLWNMAFNDEFDDFTPSKLLINEIIKFAFDNNFYCIDFMRGNDAYKHQWSNQITYNYNLKRSQSIKAQIIQFYRDKVPDNFKQAFRPQNIMIKRKAEVATTSESE